MTENNFVITLKDFGVGFSPTAHLNSLTEKGGAGSASVMTNVDVLDPTQMTQGPGLLTLTAGTEAGAITELVNFILDRPVTDGITYGISNTKLHQIAPAAVTNAGSFPHTITYAVVGSSCIEFQGSLYYFFNKSSGADCGKYDLASTFDDDWASEEETSGGPIGHATLQSAPHPVAKKEDIMLFANGRYVGTYISTTNTIAPTKLDFGAGTEVADVAFHANQWWIAVNSGVTSGTNRASSQCYLYDGSATSSILADEVAVGVQKIGFIYPLNGVVYIAYQDLSSTGGFAIGYISGRQIKPLRYFQGSLPTFAQRTLFKNTILFISSGLIYSCGAVIEQLPVQISQLADGGFSTVGALACPFGTPMVASTQSTSFKLAKFSGYDTACTWKSLVIPVNNGKQLGFIDWVVIYTKNLATNAKCLLTLEYNQAQSDSGTAKQITTANKRRHFFDKFAVPTGGVEDIRVALDWSSGNASADCAIKKIIIGGHYVEK